ncbi:MAG: ABC transporter permease subunit [Rhodanobacteraceae bacterium]
MRVWLIAFPIAAFAIGQYQGELLAEFALLGSATAALAVVWGYAGILSFAQSIMFGAGAYAVAWFGLNAGAFGVLAGLAAGMAIGGALSFLIGYVGLRGRLDPIRFALLTFICTLAAAQVAIGWTSVTGGTNGLNSIPALHVGQFALGPSAQRVVTTAIAAAVVAFLMAVARSPLGALLTMVREEPKRAASSGYNVPVIRIAAFTLCGVLTAALGGLYATQIQSVSPSIVDLPLATSFVVWALLGSRTSVSGAFLAAVSISVVTTELATRFVNYWLLIVGMLFVVVVRFFPDGAAVAVRSRLPLKWYRARQVALKPEPSSSGAGAVADRLALSARGISCHFGPFTALRGVDLDVAAGGVHCLIGPNGAGKSTFLNVLSGLVARPGGRWCVAGHDVSGIPPWALARLGVARKFQSPAVAPSLTVGQNLFLARYGRRHRLGSLFVRRWTSPIAPQAWGVLQLGGLDRLLAEPANRLSHGQRQLLELAMILTGGCDILLLDEPTAGMTHAETDQIAVILQNLARGDRLPILMVEHDINLIRKIADRVTVLADGTTLAEGTVAEITRNEQVQAAYLGHGR